MTRRHVFFGPVFAGAVPGGGYGSTPSLSHLGYKSPNGKLNVAGIGVGGQGASDLRWCAETENIVALADVDDRSTAAAVRRFPNAARYRDYRKMLDREAEHIDACIVATPDHMHGLAALAAIERGKHVYVQTPLARTISECRALREAAAKHGVATQMGNQGYSNEGTRQCAEMVWASAIGAVREVHAWTNRPLWPQGLAEIPLPNRIPEALDWDLWLGGALWRPYSAGGSDYPTGYAKGYFYHPANWRGFYDFGCGSLGDMACHILGAANLALHLSERSPIRVECVHKEGVSEFLFPKKSVIRFDFPAHGSMPPVKVFWQDAMSGRPKIDGVPADEFLGELPGTDAAPSTGQRRENTGRVFNPERAIPAGHGSGNGSVLIGEKGMITTGTYGEGTRLIPVQRMKDYRMPPPLLTRSPGHYHDWIRACKGGDPACSNFEVAAPFTEWLLLGVIATRVGGELEWDAKSMRFSNSREANEYVRALYRKGWAPAR
jgi:predicted dehydrogenase